MNFKRTLHAHPEHTLDDIKHDIRYLFQIVNQELENINQWFISNTISLNIKKKKIHIFLQTQSKIRHSTSFTKTDNKQLRNTANRINKF